MCKVLDLNVLGFSVDLVLDLFLSAHTYRKLWKSGNIVWCCIYLEHQGLTVGG